MYDSTPKECNRGYIRDKIKPVFNNFDRNLINNFIDMSNRFKDTHLNFTKILMKNTIFNKINNKSYYVYYEECYCLDYWLNIFEFLKNKYLLTKPKIKSIKNLIKKIKNQKLNIKIVLTDKMYCIQYEFKKLKIFKIEI